MNDEELNKEASLKIDSHKEIKNYFTYLDSISKALSDRLDELESENKTLKTELTKIQLEFDEKNNECYEYKEQIEIVSQKFMELSEKFEDIGEKYEKEQKRYNLIETENARNMDELKNLRKENKLLLSNVAGKGKETLRQKISGYFK